MNPENMSNSASENVEKKKVRKTIKCGNCDYIGEGELARSTWAKVLAWICVAFSPIITIIYFLATSKYRCPKCNSTFVGVKNKDGMFMGQNGGSKNNLFIFIIISIVVGIAIVGILASVVLASLSTARQKSQVMEDKALLNQQKLQNEIDSIKY